MRERERAGHNQKRRRLPASLRQDARDRVIRVEKTHFLINTHSISKRAIFSVVGQKELLLYLSPHGKTKNYLRPAGLICMAWPWQKGRTQDEACVCTA
jgi:hypothetical protein